jgi:hypothetical protein
MPYEDYFIRSDRLNQIVPISQTYYETLNNTVNWELAQEKDKVFSFSLYPFLLSF